MIDQSTLSSYNDLLSRMGQITDDLSAAVNEMRLQDIDHLLSERQILCADLIAVNQRLRQADPELRSLPAQTRSHEQLLLAKQAACESAISAQLQESRMKLAELRRKKGLRNVYGAGSQSQSRFLDNKI